MEKEASHKDIVSKIKEIIEGDARFTVCDIARKEGIRALEILKSETVQPMTMTSSMSPFPKKKKKK